jgi:phosphoglycerate dehydrogenase-like enzyme
MPVQLLLAKTALARIEPRLKALAPDLDLTLITPAGTFERKGKEVPAEQVDPDIVWVSMDAMREGYLPNVLACVVKSTKTKWMQSFLAGLDHPAFKQIIGKGVSLSKSSAQAIAIAEYVTAHAFSLIVPIDEQRAAQDKKEWTRTPFREINETRWTVVGFGAIGPQIARRVKAYDAHLTVVRRQSDDRGLADQVVQLADISKVLPQTDVVVLACALNEETRHLANDGFFDALKKGAILINIGRGALVDPEALKRGLDRDQPRHAVLDVFEQEPLPADNWMWSHPKVRISAHTSPFGSGTMRRGDELFLENLKRYRAGEQVLNEATKAEVGL